jgi:hypothetical protein
MHSPFLTPAHQDVLMQERTEGEASKLPSRMDVARSRLEHDRMSYLASDPELHVKYVVDHQRRAAELAALLAEARGPQLGPLARMQNAMGAMLIGLGERISPAAPRRSRALSAHELRRVRTGVS